MVLIIVVGLIVKKLVDDGEIIGKCLVSLFDIFVCVI